MDLDNFPKSESAKRMLSYVTKGWYDRSYIGKWLYEVVGKELDEAGKLIEELPYQAFVETATWGLAYHELKWGLPMRPDLPYEERRKLIFQKRSYHAPMTPYFLEKYLKEATGFQVHIADIHDPGPYGYKPSHPNVFHVYFLGEGTLDTGTVYAVLDRLKQSHAAYKISDRIEVCFDSRNLEQLFLKNVRTEMQLDFWCLQELRGRWLTAAIRFWSASRLIEQVQIDEVRIQLKQHSFETAGMRAASRIKMESRQVKSRQVKTAVRLYAGISLSGQEAISGLEIETKNKSRWFLDGVYTLDGAKNLDAVYKKESVE